jgi:hypothetical protein
MSHTISCEKSRTTQSARNTPQYYSRSQISFHETDKIFQVAHFTLWERPRNPIKKIPKHHEKDPKIFLRLPPHLSPTPHSMRETPKFSSSAPYSMSRLAEKDFVARLSNTEILSKRTSNFL